MGEPANPVVSPDDLRRRLDALPRVQLAHLPTPLTPCGNLSRRLGREILLKRDDLTGLALGGNKTRQFEYLLGDAIAQGADTIVAGLAAQSNYCRQLTAACAQLGLTARLVLRTIRESDFEVQGNLLLDVLAGADVTVHDVTPGQQAAIVCEVVRELEAGGSRPYLPLDRAELGAIAYVDCGLELHQQLATAGISPSAIYLAAAGESQAGLIVAMKALGSPINVVGIDPGVTWWDVPERILRSAQQSVQLLGLDLRITAEDVTSRADFAGDGYGIPSEASVGALKQVATSEGVILDPVYTSKAMAALLADVESGRIEGSGPIVFVHTGGVPALFHYRDLLGVPHVL